MLRDTASRRVVTAGLSRFRGIRPLLASNRLRHKQTANTRLFAACRFYPLVLALPARHEVAKMKGG